METVKKAINVLEIFLTQEEGISLSALARLSGLNVSTTYRMVSVLTTEGFLTQPYKRGKYSLGPKFLEFSQAYMRKIKVREVALPFMENLHKTVGESVNLAIFESGEAVYIEHIKSDHNLRMFTELGSRGPLHCSGVGKVFLANMASEEANFFKNRLLKKYTDNTKTSAGELEVELAAVHQNGFAIDNEEREAGVRCVAAPIRGIEGKVIAALSISGPSIRLSKKKVRGLGPLLREYGLKISRAMGHTE